MRVYAYDINTGHLEPLVQVGSFAEANRVVQNLYRGDKSGSTVYYVKELETLGRRLHRADVGGR